jgi:uncharacterized membrane protein
MSKKKDKDYQRHQTMTLESIKKVSPIIMILFILFIISGGVYDIIEGPSSDSILAFLLLGMILAGVFLIYNSPRVLYNKQSANTQIAFGILLSTIGFLLLILMEHIKNS